MARFLNFTKLLSKDEYKPFIGISQGQNKDEIIITYNNKMIVVEEVIFLVIVYLAGYFDFFESQFHFKQIMNETMNLPVANS